jgi:hypothetical protein
VVFVIGKFACNLQSSLTTFVDLHHFVVHAPLTICVCQTISLTQANTDISPTNQRFFLQASWARSRRLQDWPPDAEDRMHCSGFEFAFFKSKNSLQAYKPHCRRQQEGKRDRKLKDSGGIEVQKAVNDSKFGFGLSSVQFGDWTDSTDDGLLNAGLVRYWFSKTVHSPQ